MIQRFEGGRAGGPRFLIIIKSRLPEIVERVQRSSKNSSQQSPCQPIVGSSKYPGFEVESEEKNRNSGWHTIVLFFRKVLGTALHDGGHIPHGVLVVLVPEH